MPPKTTTIYNWVPSTVTDDTLKDFVTIGYLLEKNIMSYRALLRLELALVFPEEEGMLQQSSVSISLSF